MSLIQVPVFFHPRQLDHKPLYEWAFGERITHPETTHRAENILAALSEDPVFSVRPPVEFPATWLRELHDPRLSTLYQTAHATLADDATFYPTVFPKRDQAQPNPMDIHQAGYFCFDAGTPLTPTTWEAAAWSAAAAHEAGLAVTDGDARLAYALCRPPGHHAQRDLFGGYCYFNNAAIVAARIAERGRVAILDIDFHHGNGTQAIFYSDPRVLVISLHGDPREFYPYFAGWAEEAGEGAGAGLNLNIPLPAGTDGQEYLRALDDLVLPRMRLFDPAAVVLSAGLDAYKGDPLGRFALDTHDFEAIGERVGLLGKPVIAVQEGGYCTEMLGVNAVALLRGLSRGLGTGTTVAVGP
ncbi:MAG: histone deacetylase family protein [Myxococcales bacterium]|nr:histone deacetylase family protein [Myxococcales bacterium]